MKANTLNKPEIVRPKGACAHHWIIDAARGKNSKGVCRLCGAVKEFDNRGVDFFYDPEPTPSIASKEIPWQGDDEEQEWEVA